MFTVNLLLIKQTKTSLLLISEIGIVFFVGLAVTSKPSILPVAGFINLL